MKWLWFTIAVLTVFVAVTAFLTELTYGDPGIPPEKGFERTKKYRGCIPKEMPDDILHWHVTKTESIRSLIAETQDYEFGLMSWLRHPDGRVAIVLWRLYGNDLKKEPVAMYEDFLTGETRAWVDMAQMHHTGYLRLKATSPRCRWQLAPEEWMERSS